MFAWRQYGADGLSVGFTDRSQGVTPGTMGALNLGRTDVDDPSHVTENFRRFKAIADVTKIIAVHQVHGTEVLSATTSVVATWSPQAHLGTEAGQPALPVADAIVTTRDECGPGVALLVRVADCLPVVFVDRQRNTVGVAHAGREGLLAGVLRETVTAMRDRGAADIDAWVGPHVCGRCYEVPAEMAHGAWRQLPATRARTAWGTPAIDLAAGAVAQLTDLEVASQVVGACTRESSNLHSHRRDGAASGRQVGAVWFSHGS